MYPTPDLDTVLAEHHDRIERTARLRLARAAAQRRTRRERHAPAWLARLRHRRPAPAAAPAVTGS